MKYKPNTAPHRAIPDPTAHGVPSKHTAPGVLQLAVLLLLLLLLTTATAIPTAAPQAP